MKIEIRPLELEKWHKRKGAESIANNVTIECQMDSNGTYQTGLTDEEAAKYGELMGISLTKYHNPQQPHPFYSTRAAKLILANHTIFLNTDIPTEYVKLSFARLSENIAPSIAEWEKGKYPDATHVIYSEDETLAESSKKVEQKAAAYKLMFEMDDAKKSRVIAVMSDKLRNFKSARGKDTSFLNTEIGKLIEDNTKEFIEIAKLSNEIVASEAFVLECLNVHLLSKEGTGIYYMSDLIGHSISESAAYLRETSNKIINETLKQKLKLK
jgi:hypothetical protein